MVYVIDKKTNIWGRAFCCLHITYFCYVNYIDDEKKIACDFFSLNFNICLDESLCPGLVIPVY